MILTKPLTTKECNWILGNCLKPDKLCGNYFYYIQFEITCNPCNLIDSNQCNSFTNCNILCYKSHLIPSQWDSFTWTLQPIKFQDLFKEINQIAGKWKTPFAIFLQTSTTYWINKLLVVTTKNLYWLNQFCNFKIDVIKW